MRPRLALAVLLLAVAACSRPEGIALSLDEYAIEPNPVSAPAGGVVLTARNAGEIAHQLIVLRAPGAPGELPVDDGVVDLSSRGIRELARIDLISPGAAPVLRTRLEAGDYVLICNIAGHYGSGMWAPLRVG